MKNKLWMKSVNATVVQPTYFTGESLISARSAHSYWGGLGAPVYSHAVTFNPVLLKGLEAAHRHFYKRDLADRIKGETSGDLERLFTGLSVMERGVAS